MKSQPARDGNAIEARHLLWFAVVLPGGTGLNRTTEQAETDNRLVALGLNDTPAARASSGVNDKIFLGAMK